MKDVALIQRILLMAWAVDAALIDDVQNQFSIPASRHSLIPVRKCDEDTTLARDAALSRIAVPKGSARR